MDEYFWVLRVRLGSTGHGAFEANKNTVLKTTLIINIKNGDFHLSRH